MIHQYYYDSIHHRGNKAKLTVDSRTTREIKQKFRNISNPKFWSVHRHLSFVQQRVIRNHMHTKNINVCRITKLKKATYSVASNRKYLRCFPVTRYCMYYATSHRCHKKEA